MSTAAASRPVKTKRGKPPSRVAPTRSQSGASTAVLRAANRTPRESDDPIGKLRHPKKRAFLLALAELGTITGAAKRAGIDPQTAYNWERNDPDGLFGAAKQEAERRKLDSMEAALFGRGVEGWEEPVYQGGENVGRIRRFSDACLIFGLKAANPMRYRERVQIDSRVQIDQRVVSLSLTGDDLRQMSDDELMSRAERLSGDLRGAAAAKEPAK